MAKYTRTDCPLYGGEYCKKLNMKSCRTCTVTNDNAAGIKADIDAIESLMPEGGMARFFEGEECVLCKGERKNRADCYAMADIGHPEPKREGRNAIGLKTKLRIGSMLPVQLSCCSKCRKKHNAASNREAAVTLTVAIIMLAVLNFTPTAEAIAAIMGVSAEAEERKVARVICQGDCGVAKERYNYDGYTSCATAAGLAGGPKMCRFACIGLGDCAQACAFGAIKIADGLAHIDEEKCVACGQCANICPRGVIALKPVNETVIVSCRNTDSGREARAACMKACIACGRCTKECPNDAIHVEGGVAKIDEAKCTRCGACAKVCPCKCIVDYLDSIE